MDLTEDFKSFQEKVTQALINATRTASQVGNEDLGFHRSSSVKASRGLDAENEHLLRLTNKLLKAATQDTVIKPPRIKSLDGVEDNWKGLVEVIDDLLYKADSSLDEYSGMIQKPSPVDDGATTPSAGKEKPKKPVGLFDNPVMRKPQLDFHRPVNNFDTTPFKPLLQRKPHAITKLEEVLANCENGKYNHPYAFEIQQSKYPSSVYEIADPIPFQPSETSKPILVDTGESLQAMLAELRQAKEIAVDLEHHDMHSYVGLVCLMQISTREKDWIVDTLRPWREELQILNQVFADPNILKVFHGSTMDMIWLQRDLGLYVVGLFDTYHASVALKFPKRSLGYLLGQFAKFQAQKQYQMADWRIRPLPDELVEYARSDTHYLLYIYDVLRNMLLKSSSPGENLVDYVLEASKQEALQVYERPIYDEENGLGSVGWLKPLMQRTVRFDRVQFAVYRALHKWRDHTARSLDEGEQYILPAAALWTLAEQMPLSAPDFHRTLRPIPHFLRQNRTRIPEILQIIKQAKIDGINGPTLFEILQRNEGKLGRDAFLKRQPKKPSSEGITGVGATLQMLRSAEMESQSPIPSTSDSHDLPADRCLSSQLWGPTLTENAEPYDFAPSTVQTALQSVLPLSLFSTVSVSDVPDLSVTSTVRTSNEDPGRPSDGKVANTEQVDDTFVLRDVVRSQKRKAQDLNTPDLPPLPAEPGRYSAAGTANGVPDAPIDPILQERIRRHQKAQRKAEKLKRKSETAENVQASESLGTAPFDYANAESLLQVPDAGDVVNGANRFQAMNPYLKALDTSTGARRAKQSKEQPGRSMTFRS